jgi:hypothetical protein
VIDEWLLIEYACTILSMKQAALVEAVRQALPRRGRPEEQT